MKLPSSSHYDTYRKTTWLHFDDEYPRESVMKGGICFPVRYRTDRGTNETEGYAVLGGQDLNTGNVYIYSQTSWLSIDNVLAVEGDPELPVNAIKYYGLSGWLNKAWTDYYCRSFYYNQPEELSRRFRLHITRSFTVDPKPYIIEVPNYNDDEIISTVGYWVKIKKVKIEEKSQLIKDLSNMMQDDKHVTPSVHALGCCLLAFDRFPWRKPYQKPVQEIILPS